MRYEMRVNDEIVCNSASMQLTVWFCNMFSENIHIICELWFTSLCYMPIVCIYKQPCTLK